MPTVYVETSIVSYLTARPSMKHRDAIVEDLHKLRERMGRAHGFDVDRIAATIRQHERESGVARVAPSVRRRKAVAAVSVRKTAGPRMRPIGT